MHVLINCSLRWQMLQLPISACFFFKLQSLFLATACSITKCDNMHVGLLHVHYFRLPARSLSSPSVLLVSRTKSVTISTRSCLPQRVNASARLLYVASTPCFFFHVLSIASLCAGWVYASRMTVFSSTSVSPSAGAVSLHSAMSSDMSYKWRSEHGWSHSDIAHRGVGQDANLGCGAWESSRHEFNYKLWHMSGPSTEEETVTMQG